MTAEILKQDLMTELSEVLQMEIAQRHSYFQLKYFLIGKEPTHQAKMWQCLRELKNRFDSLKAIALEIEDGQDNLELLKIQRQKTNMISPNFNPLDAYHTNQPFWAEEKIINIRKLDRKIKAAEENLVELSNRQRWITEEAKFFLDSFKNLEKIEAVKNFDDFESQKQYWGEKLANNLNLKMLLGSPLDTEMIDTVLALPDDIPIKQNTIQRLNSIHESIIKLAQASNKKSE